MDRDGCRRAWLDLAPRKHRDRHGPMGPDDSSATAASREMKGGNGSDVVDGGRDGSGRERRGRSEWPGMPRGLGNEDEGSEKEVLETAAAEWQRAIAAIGRGAVAATVYLPLTAGDDDDRHLPGH